MTGSAAGINLLPAIRSAAQKIETDAPADQFGREGAEKKTCLVSDLRTRHHRANKAPATKSCEQRLARESPLQGLTADAPRNY
jgi:hypothetical protein